MSLETMRPEPTWDAASYEEVVETLAAYNDDVVYKIWGGDWCKDCRALLPDFGAALEAAAVPDERIEGVQPRSGQAGARRRRSTISKFYSDDRGRERRGRGNNAVRRRGGAACLDPLAEKSKPRPSRRSSSSIGLTDEDGQQATRGAQIGLIGRSSAASRPRAVRPLERTRAGPGRGCLRAGRRRRFRRGRPLGRRRFCP